MLPKYFFFLFFTPACFAILSRGISLLCYHRQSLVLWNKNEYECLPSDSSQCACYCVSVFHNVHWQHFPVNLLPVQCQSVLLWCLLVFPDVLLWQLCPWVWGCGLQSLFYICLMSYVQISLAVLRISSEESQHKASSTCLPFLTVVSLFNCIGGTAYMKLISNFSSALAPVITVLCSMLPSIINPTIYSMKIKEIKEAMKKLFKRNLWRRKEVFLLFAWLRFSLLHAFIEYSIWAFQETLNISAEQYLTCSG